MTSRRGGYTMAIPKGVNCGTGADGAVTISADTNIASTEDGDIVVMNYASLTVDAGKTLTVANRCKGLVIRVQGNLVLNGTITMTGKGCSGAPAGATSETTRAFSNVQLPNSDFYLTSLLSTASGTTYSIAQTGGAGGGQVWTHYGKLNGNAGSAGANGSCGGGGGAGTGYGAAYNDMGVDGLGGSAGNAYRGGSGGGGSGGNQGVGGSCAGTAASGDTGGNGGTGIGNPGTSPGGGGGGAGVIPGAGGSGRLSGIDGSVGGTGVGGVLIIAVGGSITGTGIISADGIQGGYGGRGAGNYTGGGGGGGSGGGSIVVLYNTSLGAVNIHAYGGLGGIAGYPDGVNNIGGVGGNGGAGSIQTARII